MTNNNDNIYWHESTLGEIADWASGGTPSSSNSEYYNGDIPWAIIGDLNDADVTFTSKKITQIGLENSSAKIVDPGSLLIGMYGSIGKLGIANIKMSTNQAIAFTQKIFGGIPVKYLYYYLLFSRPSLSLLGKGGAQLNISQAVLKQFPIPIPSIQLQNRIVQKLDQLFLDYKNVLDRLSILNTKLNQFEIIKLNELLTGNKKQENKRKTPTHKIASQQVSFEQEISNFPFNSELPTIPSTWKWVKLKDISDIQGGVTKGRNFKGAPTIELPYLRVANVQDGFLNLNEVKYIPIKDSEVERFLLKKGDVLLTEGGDRDKLGRGTIWNEEIEKCTYQNHIFRARVNLELARPNFISIITKSEFSRKYFYDNANQTVNLASINITVLGNLPIPLPPITDQEYIISAYNRIKSNTVSVKRKLDLIRGQMDALKNSTFEKIFIDRQFAYFEDDEPVEILMQRIEKEKNDYITFKKSFIRPKSEKVKVKKMNNSIKTLPDMIECLDKIGGKASPEALLQATSLENEIDLFFELLRKGRDENVLQVPVGKNGLITIIR